jgi:hypothetical protein
LNQIDFEIKDKHIRDWYIGYILVFMVLNQLDNNKYQYCLSRKYDAIELDDLKQIYQLLQWVKSELIAIKSH